MKGNYIPVSMQYPITSGLIQVKLDHAEVPEAEIPAFLLELEAGSKSCGPGSGKVVFDELQRVAALALERGQDLSLSAFG